MQRVRLAMSILWVLFCFSVVFGQDVDPVPTLVPPTLVPTLTGVNDFRVSESALVRIQNEGRVRIGVLYNEPPLGELNIRGEVVGYDAALGRSIAEAWEVELDFVQVTRQNAIDQLVSGEVDMLIAAEVHWREQDTQIEFSQTYYRGSQTLMVRLDDAAQSAGDLVNRRVGVVLGTSGERAVNYWQQRTGITLAVQTYLTLDAAHVALVNNDVDAIVGRRYRLNTIVDPERTRVLDDSVQPEPFAIAMRRQDVNMRNLVNHTLQYLAKSGRMAEIHSEFFPSRSFLVDTLPQWEGLGDEPPKPGLYPAEIIYPDQYVILEMKNRGTVRVAGIPQPIPDSPDGDRRIAEANARLIEQMASRWGVRVEYVPNSQDDPIRFVEQGEADIAFGVRANWQLINRVDFTSAYLLRGKRLLIKQRDDYTSFSDLRGQWIGVFASEPGAADMVRELGDSVNASNLNIFSITRDQDAVYGMLTENNYDVIFGDSIRLLPLLEANTADLKFSERCQTCDPWYTREYLALAVPRNDIDFKLLVDYTLQEISLDGTLNSVLASVTVPGESLSLNIWPGSSEVFGFSLAR